LKIGKENILTENQKFSI